MLVLSRKTNQQIKLGEDITVTVVRIKGGVVRIGIEAPDHVRVRRSELADQHIVPSLPANSEVRDGRLRSRRVQLPSDGLPSDGLLSEEDRYRRESPDRGAISSRRAS